MEIHLPKAVFTLAPIEEKILDTETIDMKSVSGDHIKLSFSKGERNHRLLIEIIDIKGLDDDSMPKIALRESGKLKPYILEKMIGRKTSIEEIELTNGIEIFLYH